MMTTNETSAYLTYIYIYNKYCLFLFFSDYTIIVPIGKNNMILKRNEKLYKWQELKVLIGGQSENRGTRLT